MAAIDFPNSPSLNDTFTSGGTTWIYVGSSKWKIQSSNSGDIAFVDLTDTPSAYTSQAGKVVAVNGTEDALEFVVPSGGLDSATASGTDTYTATISGVSAYTTHDAYEIIFTNANTGASTLNINALGAVALKKSVSTDLSSGDISAGQSFIVVYDGTNFQVIGIAGVSSIAWGDITGTLSAQTDLQTALDGKVNDTGDETIAGNKTFSGITTLGEVNLDGTPDTDETSNGPTTSTFNAGGSITKFQLVYLNNSAQWVQADADAESTTQGFLAIALETDTVGNPLKVALPGSFVRDDSWAWTVGALLYASTTAGSLTETQPTGTNDVIRIVGYAVASNIIYFNPSGSFVTHI